MKILVVGLVKNFQLTRLQKEAEKLGHAVDGCYASDLIIQASPTHFEPILKNKKFSDYQLIYLWTVGKRRYEWYVAVNYASKKYGSIIVNGKVIDPAYQHYLTPASEYEKQTENSLNYPVSVVIFDYAGFEVVRDQFSFPLIIKTSTGRQGRGVFKVNSTEELKKVINENKEASPSFIVRQFIENDGDIRVFTIGYQAIGAMKRTPKLGDFRSNISQGGAGENFDLSKNQEVKELAEKISRLTRTEIAGVDIMIEKNTGKPFILEINPGPQFTGFEKYTLVNAASAIIRYFESLKKN
jgi:RimK family alpha-L-glutamate ligase